MKRYQLFAGKENDGLKGAESFKTSIDKLESAELYAENLSKINDWVQVFDTLTAKIWLDIKTTNQLLKRHWYINERRITKNDGNQDKVQDVPCK